MAGTLKGIGVSPGVGIGPVARMGAPVGALPPIEQSDNPEAEAARAVAALGEVADQLATRRDRATGAAVAVLDAQVMMAQDPALGTIIAQATEKGRPAAHAVEEALSGFRSAMEAAGGYMAERVADLDDLRNRVVARLLHLPMPGIPQRDEPFILVADDLAPADTVDLDINLVKGLITERGGPTSHTAIIAKTLGLPAIVSCPGALDVAEGTVVVVDGAAGLVTIDPSSSQMSLARRRQADRATMLASSSGPGRTSDGHPIGLLLNLGSEDPTVAGAIDSEGIGLLRTELVFMDRNVEPSVEEQTEIYSAVFAAFSGRKVVVRTLDIGADKPLPFVTDGPGDNPALGLRGWRLRQLSPGVIDHQLQALAAAAATADCDVWAMAPMIATVQEAAGFVEAAHAVGLSRAGVMVEVPSMALQAERLCEVVDFVSLGTNDLSQYTFAADRMIGELGVLLDPWQPALLELIARTAAAGERSGTPVGVCGEAASDPLLALVLTGLGCTTLSMAAGALPEVRASLASVDLSACQALAKHAMAAADPASARAAVSEALA